MESTAQEIGSIYWNESLSDYTSLLDTTTIMSSNTIKIRQTSSTSYLEYSADGGVWVGIGTNWPVTLANNSGDPPTTTLTVEFTTDLVLSADIVGTGTNGYFIIGTSNIVVDGSGHAVTIQGITDYPGLLQNGLPGTNGNAYVTVRNINVSADGSTVANDQGWS